MTKWLFYIGFFLLVFKALYFRGVYDTWVQGMWKKLPILTLALIIAFSYLLKSPLGGEGWIIGIDYLEEITGGHVWLNSICILGGI